MNFCDKQDVFPVASQRWTVLLCNSGKNPVFFPLAGKINNYSKGMPVKGHLDRSLTSRHHASSGTDSLLPKTNAHKPTEIKRLSIIMGPVPPGTAQHRLFDAPPEHPSIHCENEICPHRFSLTRSMS